jgi:hypothetical protein
VTVRGRAFVTLSIVVLAWLPAQARDAYDINRIPCCAYQDLEGIAWSGHDSVMTVQRLAAYCAPILWFSPDEPLLHGGHRSSIRIPAAFPFEAQVDTPVVYFRLRNVLARGDDEDAAFQRDPADRGLSTLDLDDVSAIDLDYFFYYPSEVGLGTHEHDVESVEMKIVVWRRPDCAECPYSLIIVRVIGKAHGVLWYDNTAVTDEYSRFPISILVEEGKHASCTDKNGDGYYTPGFDVNRRINDAWGVRDVIRGGTLFSSGFQSWFAKVRKPEDRVFPPLPDDSPLRKPRDGVPYAEGYAQYELRPFPDAALAADDPALVPFIASKGSPDAEVIGKTDPKRFQSWLDSEPFVKSVSVALRADGDLGVSFVFPLLVVKNVPFSLTGGWFVNRIYLKDHNLRDFGYNVLYTGSASRWMDVYFSLGYESDKDDAGDKERYWTAETGLKFRASVEHSALRHVLGPITDFWGLRVGLQYRRLAPVQDVRFVVELGAGTW